MFKNKTIRYTDELLKNIGLLRIRSGLKFAPEINQDLKLEYAFKDLDLYNRIDYFKSVDLYNEVAFCFNNLSYDDRSFLFYRYFFETVKDKTLEDNKEYRKINSLKRTTYNKYLKIAILKFYDLWIVVEGGGVGSR